MEKAFILILVALFLGWMIVQQRRLRKYEQYCMDMWRLKMSRIALRRSGRENLAIWQYNETVIALKAKYGSDILEFGLDPEYHEMASEKIETSRKKKVSRNVENKK